MSEEHKTDVEDNAGDNQNDDNQADNQNTDDNKSSDQKPAENQNDSDDKDDSKEHNRKGYESRKKGGDNSEIESLKQEISSLKETVEGNAKDQEFRKAHPEITDDVFNSLKAQAKGSGKSYDDVLEDPVFKGYLETETAKSRVDNATVTPSTRTSTNKQESYADMDADAFQAKRNEILSER